MVNKNRLLEKINKQESFLSPTGYRIGFFFRNDNYLTYREDGLEILMALRPNIYRITLHGSDGVK